MLSSSQTFEGRPTPPPPTSSGLIARTIALGTEIVRAVMLSGSQTFERQPTLPSPTSSRLVARTIAPSNSSPDRPESNSTLPHLHSHPTSMTNTQNEVHSWTSQGVCRPPGRLESNSTLPHLLSYPTSTANTQNEVLSWTSQDPRQSLLFSPWGIVYRFQTDTNAPGQLITILWRTIRSNKEDRVAKLEWAPNGGLGRATIGRTPLPMADLIRRDPQLPNSRVFTGPDGFQYRWRPSPNTNSQDIGLQDPNNNVIAFIRPTRPTRYQVGDVYAELHFVRSAGTGIVMHPPLMDMVTVTAMLYRFASAYNL
ncbi:hypothetical protein BJY52DRAFT_100473 [Lactarius psammicola]|nr:hypothetical protein BJY52DRAFT_100473 [Lactarius psammicola]